LDGLGGDHGRVVIQRYSGYSSVAPSPPPRPPFNFSSGTRNYQLQRSTDLLGWSAVAPHENIPGTGGVIEVSIPSPSGFYRIAAKRDF